MQGRAKQGGGVACEKFVSKTEFISGEHKTCKCTAKLIWYLKESL